MEQASQAATVLMLDLSLSMALRGNFQAAKKVALALDNLIRTHFPKDSLYIVCFSTYAREIKADRLAYLVCFSTYAREIKADRLAYLTWDEFDPYTNIQHGLAVARKLLAHAPGGTKQIIMISDGEPTAHVDGGQHFCNTHPAHAPSRRPLKR